MDTPSSMPAHYLSLGGYYTAGVIITAREQTTDERRALHCTGTSREATKEIVERLDGMPGDWRVLSVSTPATIYRDLQGTRDHPWTDETNFPERFLLSIIGRRDRLDPSLEPRVGGKEIIWQRRRSERL